MSPSARATSVLPTPGGPVNTMCRLSGAEVRPCARLFCSTCSRAIRPWITERSRADDWANAREMRTLLEKAREAQALRIATDPSADLSRIEIVDLLKATGRG